MQGQVKYWSGYYQGVLNYLKEKYGYSDENITNRNNNFVLIIDEINRGNVSQIFGELITLLEEDKREGNIEGLKVQLPYSKEPFSVPPNLYTIGTMNTADRSVEALDTALRRRFSFTEMAPRPDLIEREIVGFKLPKILTTINKRIEKLIDKDHMIGHSYFLSVKNLDNLKSVFQNQIIPLLQEYFFGDHGKIGLVLGLGFITRKNGGENIFADVKDYDASPLLEREVYHLKNVLEMDDDKFEEALKILMKIKVDQNKENQESE